MSRRRRRDSETLSPADAVPSEPLAKLLSPTPAVFQAPILSPHPYDVRLNQVEDRRTFHPLGQNRPTRLLSGHPTPPNKIKPAKFERQLPFGVNFALPKETVVCVRRKQRKEVLHALKKTGGGGGARRRRRPHKNWTSKIGC